MIDCKLLFTAVLKCPHCLHLILTHLTLTFFPQSGQKLQLSFFTDLWVHLIPREFSIFIRQSQAIPIIRKVESIKENYGKRLSEVVSPRKPFGLPTNYQPKEKGVPCWFIQRIGLKYANKQDILDDNKLLNKWKFLVPKAPIAGQTDFSKPVGFYYD